MNDLRLSASDVASIIETKHQAFPLGTKLPRPNNDVERDAIRLLARINSIPAHLRGGTA